MFPARLAISDPPLGCGAVAAIVVGLAAALCESLARASVDSWADARGVVVQAGELRRRADAAATDNARAYALARERLRPAQTSVATGRDAMLRAALLETVDTLLLIGRAAADCAGLAAVIVGEVIADLRPDAAGAAELASGAAATVWGLVSVNLALTASDPARGSATAMLSAARESAASARRAATG
jgi:formiminotetrahydrofolate cyclodeaminase